MTTIFYVDCFSTAEKESHGFAGTLNGLQSTISGPRSPATLMVLDAHTPEELHEHLTLFIENHKSGDMLIVGAHGHRSRMGFCVNRIPVRWHDLAFLLRGRMQSETEFIFYSCKGGYPGISHVFGRESGPSFVWGPRISVRVEAMRYAAGKIIETHFQSMCCLTDKIYLVDEVNAWGRARYPDDVSHHLFLRVWWAEGSRGRYPDSPNTDLPDGTDIPLRGWGS